MQIAMHEGIEKFANLFNKKDFLEYNNEEFVNVDSTIMCKMLSHPKSVSILFPEAVVIRNNENFDAQTNNVSHILGDNTYEIFCTKNKTEIFNSISFGTPMDCKHGLLYNIDYQGEENLKLVKSHLLLHLKKVSKYWVHKGIMVHLFLPRDLLSDSDLDNVHHFCANCLGLSNGGVELVEQWHMVHDMPIDSLKKRLFGKYIKAQL